MAFKKRNFSGGPRHKRNSYGGGRGSYQSRGSFQKSFDVRCAQCSTATTVPFKPNGSKPVLCRDCFRGADKGSFKPKRFDHKPAFGGRGRSQDFGASRPAKGPDFSKDIRQLNEKLDRILEILSAAEIESAPAPVPTPEITDDFVNELTDIAFE